MSISHWGLIPGWMVPEHALAKTSRAIWQPQSFEDWCAVFYGDWIKGPFVHEAS